MLYLSTLYCGPLARTGKGRGREGTGLYPELAVLGITEGSSPALVSLVGRQCALLPSYQIAQQELAARGTQLDIKVVHRLARQLGAAVLTCRTRALLRWRAGLVPASKELAGKRVAAMIDGGRTRLRTVIRKQRGRGKGKKQRRRYKAEWREPKLLIIFEIVEWDRLADRMLLHGAHETNTAALLCRPASLQQTSSLRRPLSCSRTRTVSPCC